MKRIISIVTAVCASIVLFTACSKDNSITELDGLHVSSSYVSIAEKGATTTITLHAAGDWKLEKVTTKKNKVEWLTVSPTTGHAGETQISFTAPASLDGRTAEVIVTSNGETECTLYLTRQGENETTVNCELIGIAQFEKLLSDLGIDGDPVTKLTTITESQNK